MNRSTFSLMQPSIGGKTDLSPFDLQAAPLLYTRTRLGQPRARGGAEGDGMGVHRHGR